VREDNGVEIGQIDHRWVADGGWDESRQCMAEHEDSWVCTLDTGHLSGHVAHYEGGEVCHRWGEPRLPAEMLVENGL
jgi:hypothetical protein